MKLFCRPSTVSLTERPCTTVFDASSYPDSRGFCPDTRYQLWPNKACVTRNFQSVCKTNNLIGQTSKAHQSKQSDWSNCTHCAPRLGEIEINFRFRATKLPFLKCWPCLVSLYLGWTRGEGPSPSPVKIALLKLARLNRLS